MAKEEEVGVGCREVLSFIGEKWSKGRLFVWVVGGDVAGYGKQARRRRRRLNPADESSSFTNPTPCFHPTNIGIIVKVIACGLYASMCHPIKTIK
jgi:hypothetical protein